MSGSTTITIDGFMCRLDSSNLPMKAIGEIDRTLSFEIPGAKFMTGFGGWDGRKYLMNKNLEFQYGLLDRVKEILNKNNINYTIIDHRKKTATPKIDIDNYLKLINKIPRDYQINAADKVFTHDCGVYRMSTGSGKSLTSALMIANLGKTSILYVIGTDLLYQMHKLYTSIFKDHKIGIIGDGKCEIGEINVASVWSVGVALGLKKNKIVEGDYDAEKAMDKEKYTDIRVLLKKAKVHIFDECHIASCDTIVEIGKAINPENIYGMSASPWRDDNSDLLIESLLGNRIVDISASELIKKGFLVKPIINFVYVPPIKGMQKQYQNIYKKYIIHNPERNGLIVKWTKQLVEKGYKPLVLFDKIDHGNVIHELLRKNLNCRLLSGKDSSDKRDDVKTLLEDGKLDCIIASRIYDIGVDIPALSGLVAAGGGKSSVRALQRIGRVIRTDGKKKQAAVVDFYDDAPYLRDHARLRKKIYATESEFKIIWPQGK